jgi:hypothetical protein
MQRRCEPSIGLFHAAYIRVFDVRDCGLSWFLHAGAPCLLSLPDWIRSSYHSSRGKLLTSITVQTPDLLDGRLEVTVVIILRHGTPLLQARCRLNKADWTPKELAPDCQALGTLYKDQESTRRHIMAPRQELILGPHHPPKKQEQECSGPDLLDKECFDVGEGKQCHRSHQRLARCLVSLLLCS